MKSFTIYLREFASMKVKKTNGKIAPHKAILLISLMDLIAKGTIKNNHIFLDNEIRDRFIQNWNELVSDSDVFKPNAWTPFWHLKNEPFWHFQPILETSINNIVPSGQTASIGLMRKNIQYAFFDEELFEMLAIERVRNEFRGLLIRTYIDFLFES